MRSALASANMAALSKALSGLIISVAPRAERFTHWQVFSRDEGFISVTVPAKMALPLSLFDRVELLGTVRGRGFFASEVHLVERPLGLAKNLAAFNEAGQLARLVLSGFSQLPDYQPIFDLFAKALEYYSTTSAQPALVTFKALYKMLAAEGFPVKEDWLEKLSTPLQKKAVAALKADITSNEPLDPALSAALLGWMNQELGIKI